MRGRRLIPILWVSALLLVCLAGGACQRNNICPETPAEAPTTMGPNAKKKKRKGAVAYNKDGTLKRKSNQPR